MAGESRITTDRREIRRWVEARRGWPASALGSEGRGEQAGMLRIGFEGEAARPDLERITWEEFFETFEESDLAFLYQEETQKGTTSRFFKFVRREKRPAQLELTGGRKE